MLKCLTDDLNFRFANEVDFGEKKFQEISSLAVTYHMNFIDNNAADFLETIVFNQGVDNGIGLSSEQM